MEASGAGSAFTPHFDSYRLTSSTYNLIRNLEQMVALVEDAILSCLKLIPSGGEPCFIYEQGGTEVGDLSIARAEVNEKPT